LLGNNVASTARAPVAASILLEREMESATIKFVFIAAASFAMMPEANATSVVVNPAGGIGNAPVSATPLPAALSLFASGLGALGLLGWRRKRRAPTSSMSVLACFPSMRGQQYFVGPTDDCK
jgi:hypothetical protein